MLYFLGGSGSFLFLRQMWGGEGQDRNQLLSFQKYDSTYKYDLADNTSQYSTGVLRNPRFSTDVAGHCTWSHPLYDVHKATNFSNSILLYI